MFSKIASFQNYTLLSVTFLTSHPKLTLISSSLIASIAGTILAIKIGDCYNPEAMNRLKLTLMGFQKNSPLAPLVALVFVAVMGVFSLNLGFIAAIPFGIYIGCRFEMDRIRRNQIQHASGGHLNTTRNQIALS